MSRGQVLTAVLRRPEAAAVFDLEQWARLIGQARNADLLGQLRATFVRAGLWEQVPTGPARHLEIGWLLAQRHREAVRWELQHIHRALQALEMRVVVLKGAAYCLTDARAAAGRIFNDVDILVPQAQLAVSEEALVSRGWVPELPHPYDQRYYRAWMHELPPLQHKDRATVLDVHHTIVPPSSGIFPDANALIARARPVSEPGLEGLYVLAPEDMLMHSACHLFFNEFHKGLRDLYDLHALFDEFGQREAFWPLLTERALACGLARPLLDAMEQCERVFGTAVPEESKRALGRALGPPRLALVRNWMLHHVLQPDHPSCRSRASGWARWLAFARSHWLRTPPSLLLYHLAHKAVRGRH